MFTRTYIRVCVCVCVFGVCVWCVWCVCVCVCVCVCRWISLRAPDWPTALVTPLFILGKPCVGLLWLCIRSLRSHLAIY